METIAQELLNLLSVVVDPSSSSDSVKNATATLNTKFYAVPECIPILLDVVTSNAKTAIRQLAGVELRKRIAGFWESIPVPKKNEFKNIILQFILTESNPLVRNAGARVVSEIAMIEVSKGEWNELLPFLYQCCGASEKAHRESAIYVIYTLLDMLSEDQIQSEFESLFNILSKALMDVECKEVQVVALQAISKLADFVGAEDHAFVGKFQELVPSMFGVVNRALVEGDEESVAKGFECFDSILVLEAPILNKHFSEMIQFIVGIATTRNYPTEIRILSLSFLMFTVIYKKSLLQSHQLVVPIIQTILPLGAEEDPEDADDDSTSSMALKVVNTFSTNLPPSLVFPVVMQFVETNHSNTSSDFRKASMLAIAVLVEGCADYMRSYIDIIFPIICKGLQDNDVIVRKAACVSLSYVAEELDSEIASNHDVLMPLFFNLLNDTSVEIRKQACNALDAVLEGLGSKINGYLPALMEILDRLLDSSPAEIKATVVASIGSAAHAAKKNFSPYFQHIYNKIRPFVDQNKNSDEILLRGITIDTMGAIAEAVGAESFRPFMPDMINVALSALPLNLPRLRECSFCFFAVIARVYKNEFNPYVKIVVPELINSCEAEEKDIDNFFDSSEQSESDGTGYRDAMSAIAEEKEIAANALGEIFEAVGSEFLPYLEKTVVILVDLLQHFHEAVRRSAAGSLFTTLKTLHILTGNVKWESGLPLKYEINNDYKAAISTIIPAYLKMAEEEDDKLTLAHTFQDLVELLEIAGPCIISNDIEGILKIIVSVLDKSHVCQDDDDDEFMEEEQAEYDSILLGACTDLIAALALILGESFATCFKYIYDHIGKYLNPCRSSSDVSMAVGCLADIVVGMKGNILPFVDLILPIALEGLQHEAEEVRSNSTFCAGLLCEYASTLVAGKYSTILELIQPQFTCESTLNLRDNACGAVCRMILGRPELVPIEQVIPVVLGCLPLTNDYAENEPIFRCIFQLFKSHHSIVYKHLNEILQLLSKVLSPPEDQLSPELQQQIPELLAYLSSQDATRFNHSVQQLQRDQQEILAKQLHPR